MVRSALVFTAACAVFMTTTSVSAKRPSEFVVLPGHTVKSDFTSPLPHVYTSEADLPKAHDWRNYNGKSYVTKMLNQHIPQYCGSCWAHGALSALADRVKISRDAKGDDVNFAIQFILNCGTEVAGSCHGGSATGVYEFVKQVGHVPYDTCLQYRACSAESTEGACAQGNFECSAINTCRTCSTFKANGGFCSEIDIFPNATIAEYGELPNDPVALKAEIYRRGPIPCGVNANEIENYTGGIVDMPHKSREVDHIISIVGWGYDDKSDSQYWIVRNSWGQYWGEMGYFRIKMGGNQLGIEGECSWATPGHYTEVNFPCSEDGHNCVTHTKYQDPSVHFMNTKQAKVEEPKAVETSAQAVADLE